MMCSAGFGVEGELDAGYEAKEVHHGGWASRLMCRVLTVRNPGQHRQRDVQFS